MHKRIVIKIFGDVQGIGFRYSAWLKARELGLAGFVRNEHDGSVYIEAEGPPDKLEELLRWCKNDAPGRIKKIEREFLETTGGHREFEVK